MVAGKRERRRGKGGERGKVVEEVSAREERSPR